MTLSPRATLALVLAAGLATPALAQTSPQTSTQPAGSETGWNSQHPQSSYATQPQSTAPGMPAQPQMNSPQPQASNPLAQPAEPMPSNPQAAGLQPNANGQMPPMPSAEASTNGPMQPGAPMQGADSGRVSQAQAQLSAAGLYNGPRDGVMDPDTRAAIARFQEQRGLPRTERLDPRTMSALSSNQTTGSGSSMAQPVPAAPNGPGNQAGAPPSAGGMSGNMAPAQPQH